jgi:hypothetical protein
MGSAFSTGEVIAGEIVYYPSTAPLRGLLAPRAQGDEAVAWPAPPQGLSAGFAAYEAALARQPWLEIWPLAASGVTMAALSDDRLALRDAEGLILPLDIRQTAEALPLLGLDSIAVIALWDGWSASLLAADTPIGRWYGS